MDKRLLRKPPVLSPSIARDVLRAFEGKKKLTYIDLSKRTGHTRNQLARAVKYLRSAGYVFATYATGGTRPAVLEYKGYF